MSETRTGNHSVGTLGKSNRVPRRWEPPPCGRRGAARIWRVLRGEAKPGFAHGHACSRRAGCDRAILLHRQLRKDVAT